MIREIGSQDLQGEYCTETTELSRFMVFKSSHPQHWPTPAQVNNLEIFLRSCWLNLVNVLAVLWKKIKNLEIFLVILRTFTSHNYKNSRSENVFITVQSLDYTESNNKVGPPHYCIPSPSIPLPLFFNIIIMITTYSHNYIIIIIILINWI